MERGEPPPGEYTTIDATGLNVLPGFIDVHVHGAMGCDTMDASEESLTRMARFFARHGVTSFFPTTITAPHEHIMAALRTVKSMMDRPTGGARIMGAHLEGPYINAAMIGAQNPAYVRRASQAETRELLDLDVIQRITLAPEFVENQAFIQDAAAQGVAVSAGHTQATAEDMQKAIRLGLRHTTHTFNAMTGLHHREPGTVGAALAFEELICELIPDTIHVHPVVMRALYNAKDISGIILITDSIAGTGMPDGQYQLGGLAITVAEREARLTEGGALAGSVLTFERGFEHFQQATSLRDFNVTWFFSSHNAAEAHSNLRRKKSILAPGRDADIVLLDGGGKVRYTIVGGEVVYDSENPTAL